MSKATRSGLSSLRQVLREDTWQKEARARDGLGRIVDPRSLHAARLCVYGACVRIDDRRLVKVLASRIRLLDPAAMQAEEDDVFTIMAFNDRPETTWSDIAALISDKGPTHVRRRLRA